MKRSEMMFDIIRPIIEKHLVNVQIPENVESYITIDIMNAIEKAGMLPPTDEEKSFKMLPNGEMIYQVNEWEPEYDTNEGYDGLED